jgi:mono/diheme cytochrome c family protein
MSRWPAACIALVLGAASCRRLPGEPSARPERATDFASLYAKNCAACHGAHGGGGAALALDNPVYLALASDRVVSNVISRGVAKTPMPAFAQSAGGTLTPEQVAALVRGIRAWQKPLGEAAPPYVPAHSGDATRGAQVFQTFCSSCHGANGRGGTRAGSVVDASYLALVSDQDLRSVVIAGRPELGAPDWRSDVLGRPMTFQQITDVVVWLSAQRTRYPGQPYEKKVSHE